MVKLFKHYKYLMFSSYTAILHDVVEKNVTVLAHQVNAVHCRR